jgi:hypothetical protein
MNDQEPIYDVAISFLYQDLALAQALYDELSKGLEVFFFPRNQEELAGSEGLESMREPFRSQSRINVVLYRPRWGKTPWTAVEEVAVKESCLATSYRTIFFFVIEPTPEIPTWLPETHVRFNYADFNLEQAVGAIKARVKERGGHFKPMTPSRKVAILQAEEEYQRARRQISSHEGMQKIQQSVELLFNEIAAQLDDVNANGHMAIDYETKVQFGQMEQYCRLGMQRLGMSVVWFQRYSNMLDEAHLIVSELNENAILPPGHMRLRQPETIKQDKFVPDLSRAREYVWRSEKGTGDMVGSKDLAEKLVLQFLNLVERDRAGMVKRKGWY